MAFDVSWSQLPPVQDGRLADGDPTRRSGPSDN